MRWARVIPPISMGLLGIGLGVGLLTVGAQAQQLAPPLGIGGRLHVDIDLVLVNVTVTDPFNRFVTGLNKQHFTLSEDKAKQQILHFSREDVPVSLGIVFDVSDSMNLAGKFRRASQAAVQFLRTANPADEFFVVTFADKPSLLSDFTTSIETIQNRLLFTKPDGRTALLDALYLAINTMRRAQNSKKALLVISDGGDNRSRYSKRNIRAAIQESDIQIYSIGIFDPQGTVTLPELLWGPKLLQDISQMTGGRMFPIEVYNVNELPDIAMKISTELRNQYILGYHSTNDTRDGAWRRIKVKVKPPYGLPPLNVFTREGYYAPSQ